MEFITIAGFFVLLFLTVFNPLFGIYNLLFIAYIRPQDHYESLSNMHPAQLVLFLTMAAFALHQIVLRRKWVSAPQNKALFGLLFCVLLSRLWAFDLERWYEAAEDFTRICLVYFMIINLVTTPRKLKVFYLFVVFIYLFVGIRFYYNYKWGVSWSEGSKPGDLSYGFMANADDLGFGMAMALPLVLVPIFYVRNIFMKVLAGLASTLFMLSSLGSGSRGAAIGTIWAFLISFLSQIRYSKLRKRHFLIGTMAVIVLFTLFIERYRWTLLDYKDQIMDTADTGRVGREATWGAAQRMIMSHPVFGVGRGQYIPFWENHYEAGVFGYQVAHNILYEVTAELGIVGILLYLYFSLYGMKELRLISRKYKGELSQNQFYDMIFAIYLVALMVFYINGQFITVAFYWHLYLFVALFVCTKNIFVNKVVAASAKKTLP